MDAPLKTYESAAAEHEQPVIPRDAAAEPEPSDGAAGFDLSALAGILSLLGTGGEDSPTASASSDADTRHSGSGEDAAQLLRTLRPYLQNTRLLSVDRAAMLLETARSVRGILRSVKPFLGELSGGKK